MPTLLRADSMLDAAIATAVKRADANDLLYQLESSRDYDQSPDLEKIRSPLLAVNSADDLINPPELGILEREIKRVPNGRAVIIPLSPETRGHGTHTAAAVWKQYLAELLAESARKCVRDVEGAAVLIGKFRIRRYRRWLPIACVPLTTSCNRVVVQNSQPDCGHYLAPGGRAAFGWQRRPGSNIQGRVLSLLDLSPALWYRRQHRSRSGDSTSRFASRLSASTDELGAFHLDSVTPGPTLCPARARSSQEHPTRSCH